MRRDLAQRNLVNAMPPTAAEKTGSPRKAPRKLRPPASAAKWALKRTHGVQILQAPPLTRLNWLVHGFSTRPGGVSELKRTGPHGKKEKVLNLGFTGWDSRKNVLENRKAFFGALGAGKMSAVTLRQIHSDMIHRVDSPQPSAAEAPQADALITQQPGVLLVVQTADCIPILLADAKNRAVAAIHSGWRGTLRRIAEKTLGRMRMEFGTRPEDVVAAIGPGIGRCCYEVGSDVAKEFSSQFPEAATWFEGPFDALASGENDPNWLPWLTMRPPGHAPPSPSVQLDLLAANRSILANAGVPPAQIVPADFCTACRTDLFFSYRRERDTGRLMAAIGIR
jgi:YfiH family protein